MLTYQDQIDALIDYVGGNNSTEATRKARRAVLNAYTEMMSSHEWMYYFDRGRIVTEPAITDGTIQYTDATGVVILTPDPSTGTTFPADVFFYNIILNQFPVNIISVQSNVQVTIDPATRLGYDLPAGTTFTLYRDTYALPTNFRNADEVINLNNTAPLQYAHPRDWLNFQRIRRGPATPRLWTWMGDVKYSPFLTIKFFPAPDLNYDFDYLYMRTARPLNIVQYATGSASSTAGSQTITGSGTTWSPSMVGSVFRLSQDNITVPTGPQSYNPSATEDFIFAVNSPTSLTLNSNCPLTLGPVKYAISDPIDIEDIAMRVYMSRECEKQMRLLMRMKASVEEITELKDAMFRAWETDARNIGRRAAGRGNFTATRLANMPYKGNL
jgi:hypothetical protein